MQEFSGLNPQELIKNTLYSFEIEDRNYNSSELITTLRQSTFLPPKSHSFRQLSDWNNRQRVDSSQPLLSSKNQLTIFNIGKESDKFSLLSVPKRRQKLDECQYPSLKKQKFQLAPISMTFQNKKTGTKHKKDGSELVKYRIQEANMSIYQSNYHPLNVLYKIRTRQRQQKQRYSQTEELPFIVPQCHIEHKFPKTERVSSILRLMKRNQQIRSLRNKNSREKQDIFKLPFNN